MRGGCESQVRHTCRGAQEIACEHQLVFTPNTSKHAGKKATKRRGRREMSQFVIQVVQKVVNLRRT